MSEHSVPGVSHESVNSLVILRENAWVPIDGPFSFAMDGMTAELTLPLSEDDYGAISDREKQYAVDGVGYKAVVLADGGVKLYGEIQSAHQVEDDLLVSIRNIAAQDGEGE